MSTIYDSELILLRLILKVVSEINLSKMMLMGAASVWVFIATFESGIRAEAEAIKNTWKRSSYASPHRVS